MKLKTPLKDLETQQEGEFPLKKIKRIINYRSKKINSNERVCLRVSAMEPTLKQAFYNDIYSHPFNVLRILGLWNLDTESTLKRNLFLFYKGFIQVLGWYLSVTAIIDLYQCRKDFRKVVFNVCTTSLITGIALKNLHVQLYSKRLNQLRMNLFRDGWNQKKNPEDVAIRESFLKLQIYHQKVFYYASYSLLPLWLITSLMTLVWGPRQLPFSIWTPISPDTDLGFFFGFIYHTVGSIFVVAETIHADLAMFALLLQIATQYCILANKIRKIDEIYKGKFFENEKEKKDINKMLLNHQTKEKLRECVQRQLTLMSYVKELELVYNKPMMIQLVCGFLLSIGNGLELIVVSMNFSVKLSYQVGYSLIVLGDVFMCCNLADLLLSQGRKVVWSLYDIAWYEMDNEIRKYLTLVIIGAQKIQPLTAAKMFSLNLTTFLGLLKNVYSWLALFRQLVIKK